jgi:hypothetical protein
MHTVGQRRSFRKKVVRYVYDTKTHFNQSTFPSPKPIHPIDHATLIGISLSGLTRWLNQDCACSRLFLALRKLTRAATHSRPANPIPAPIPAFALVLRPVEVDGAVSKTGAVGVVGVAVEGGIEDMVLALLDEVEDEDVELVLLDETEDEDIDAGDEDVSALM